MFFVFFVCFVVLWVWMCVSVGVCLGVKVTNGKKKIKNKKNVIEINMEALIEDTCLPSNETNAMLTETQKKIKLTQDTQLAETQAKKLLKIAQKCVKEGSVSLIRLLLDENLAFLWPTNIRNKFLESLNVLFIYFYCFFFCIFFASLFVSSKK